VCKVGERFAVLGGGGVERRAGDGADKVKKAGKFVRGEWSAAIKERGDAPGVSVVVVGGWRRGVVRNFMSWKTMMDGVGCKGRGGFFVGGV